MLHALFTHAYSLAFKHICHCLKTLTACYMPISLSSPFTPGVVKCGGMPGTPLHAVRILDMAGGVAHCDITNSIIPHQLGKPKGLLDVMAPFSGPAEG